MVGREDNTEQTLRALGFERWTAWDMPGKNPSAEYRLVTPHATFRAHEVRYNGPRYVRLGRVVNAAGQVCAWGWMDCDSKGSVARKVAAPAPDAAPYYCCAYCARRQAREPGGS